MIKIKIILALFVGLSSLSVLNGQEFKDHMSDITWVFYNKNIQSFNNQRLGESLKYGLDNNYVDNLISEDNPMYHDVRSFYKETYSIVDFNREINKPYYLMEFDKDQTLTVQEVLFYLADKYSAFFEGPDRYGFVSKDEAKARMEELDLKSSHKLILKERWYYHNSKGKMVSRVMDIGFISDNSKSNSAALWLDYSYMKYDDLQRIRPNNMEGLVNIIDYLELPSFTRDFYQVNYSTYEEQKKLYKFSTQVDAYFWKYELDNQFRSYEMDDKVKKKWKKNKVKAQRIIGSVNENKERIGQWEVRNSEGNKRAVFTISNHNANGPYKLYHTNGELKEMGNLVEGRKNDTILTFDISGKKIGSQVYTLGTLNGPTKFFFRNGTLHTECKFENDSLVDKFSSFYADGSAHISGECQNGFMFGAWLINVKLNEVMCGYLNDENNYSQLSSHFEMNALDDCIATFEIYFKHKKAKECYRGLCVIPEFNSLIR